VKELIKKLVAPHGPSGEEGLARAAIAEAVAGLTDEVRTDALGNLIACKRGRGPGKKVMLAAHMDEIGIIVTAIDDKGFLRFANIGGVNPVTLPGRRVVFANGTAGVIGLERIDDIKEIKFPKLYLDIGARNRAGAESLAKVGDMAVFAGPFVDLGERVVAKAMDDRIGCVVLVKVLEELKESAHDLYCVFTVQEEVGLRGARTSAYGIEPDVGIAVDVTGVGDTPKAHTMEVALGKGAAIKVKDASVICHPGLRRHLEAVAQAHQIPHQLEVLVAGGTDAGAIQLARSGVVAGVVSVPCRYIHTPSEMVDVGDVRACVDLLVKTLEGDLELPVG
jgi:endoglucanase